MSIVTPGGIDLIVRIGIALGLVFIAGMGRASAQESNRAGTPNWIWHTPDRGPGQEAGFSKPFSVTDRITSAVLRCMGESAGLVVSLDGRQVLRLEPYDPLARLDLTESIGPGKHRLDIRAHSTAGPAAFFVLLELQLASGRTQYVVSNSSWATNQGQPTVEFGDVDDRFLIPRSRQVGIKATDNYEQWKHALGSKEGTSPATFSVTKGFEVQLVRSAASDEDSWVSMAFDPKGRVIIAKESVGLLRMTLSKDGRRVTETQLINDSLRECRGILPLGRDLYVNANNSRGLFRLRGRKDGFGEPELVFASSGGVGHGRNDLALGPDGMIYSIHGDAVDLPRQATDLTSPYRDRRAREGHLLRIDPSTGGAQLLAAGLRNPFGIDFSSTGDVFTYDADAEYDMGSPWYRPTRVSHLVTGGDYGWRAVTHRWPPYYPDHEDNARPNLDIGKGSPTAVKFGTRSRFPRRYREALFILDWAYGRVLAVHVIPRGASYVMTAETFLQGRPLNVTDLDFSPDGSMYFVTGGRKTLSALYRVKFAGAVDEERPRDHRMTRQQKIRAEFATQSRAVRRRLEAELLEGSSNDSEELWKQLGDADPWVRQAAVNVMERKPTRQWAEQALQKESLDTAAFALLALARCSSSVHPKIVTRLNELPLTKGSRSEKLAALQAYSLCIGQLPKSSDLLLATEQKLNRLYPDREFAVNRLLSELLVRLESESVVPKTMGLLETTNDQRQQMHYLHTLRSVRSGWSIKHRRIYFQLLAEADRYLGGAGLPDFLKKIREEAMATLSQSEKSGLADVIEGQLRPTTTSSQSNRTFVRKWTVDDVLSLAVAQEPSRRRGKAAFQAASCSSCHRVARHGTLIGPELTSVSRRFSRRDLLKSIIHPSQVIADNYRSLKIVTTDGEVFVGQVGLGGDYRSPILRLATDPTQPLKTVEIQKSQIDIQQTSATSWMPEGLLNTLTGQEILDLLAYIEAGGE